MRTRASGIWWRCSVGIVTSLAGIFTRSPAASSAEFAALLGARVTPEAFVIDADRVLRYRGRIDDTYITRAKRRDQPTRDDLQNALDDVLAGKPVTRPETEATGCPIARIVATKKAP